MIGDDRTAADRILDETAGWAHVVAAYQVATVMQHVMRTAKARGDRVVVYSEAPCEMCLGWKALAKRAYYHWVLPRKLQKVIATADCILSQSGTMGRDRLIRLGWKAEQIIPFGYASSSLEDGADLPVPRSASGSAALRVLHLGSETPYRGADVLKTAVALSKKEGVIVNLTMSGGTLSIPELIRTIRESDIVVGCGLCEPWGMRINDAVLAGKPVIVSEGMGVAYMVESEGCGLVVPKGDAKALSVALIRCAKDRAFLHRLALCAHQAARNWSPAVRAKVFLNFVWGSPCRGEEGVENCCL